MPYLAPKRPRGRPLGAVEVICILVVVAALVALVWWIIANAGGGHLLT